MTLKIRFVGGVDARLKKEVVALGRWLRRWYSFRVDLEVRFVNDDVLYDVDGAKCFLRWWQNANRRPVFAEIAVGSFGRNLRNEGPNVAYPTVVAATGRALKYYNQAVRNKPWSEKLADRWGDRLMKAYIDGSKPPRP